MRLYFSPGACSLSPHIVAKEAGLPLKLSRVTFSAEGRTTEQGEDFYQVNPRGGYVPALRLDTDEVLVEGAAIIQYLADQAPEKKLVPEKGSMEHYRLLEWITFISTEVHKTFSPIYRPGLPESEKEIVVEKLTKRFGYLNEVLGKTEYLLGTFSIADAYAYTILRWAPRAGMQLAAFPNLLAFMTRMETREGVQQALKEEGLEPYKDG